MADALRHPGAVLGVARFFHAPRASRRGVLDSRPGEGRLLAYAIAAAAVMLAGRMLALAAMPGVDERDMAGSLAAHAAGFLIFVPLAWYGMAALGTLIARLAGGSGSWRDGRAAFFWAALVASPVMALSAVAQVRMTGAPLHLVVLVGQVGPVFFAWALAQCYAEAFGFRRSWAVFAVIAALVLAILGAASMAQL